MPAHHRVKGPGFDGEWLQRWIQAGSRHIVFRFAGGDQLAQVDEAASRLLARLRRG